MTFADIEIEIDGKKLSAKANQTVIQVADEAGIYIPRFCYHKELSIPANCRMCLVEMEKSPKAVPACATPVAPGMKIFTKSAKTIAAQRAVMEFLLINHPLDCPICDQGGECELQDLAMGYGSAHSSYDEMKRAVPDQDLGPLVATEMTRCIYCTRCVRFGSEVAGLRELGEIGRGEFKEISTFVAASLQSEVSGNIIDLCPVGALTSKPYRFTGRAWELNQAPSISPHDCVGTNLNVHTRYGQVMRIVAKENDHINQTWIADRDRFSYTGLYRERVAKPMIRTNGQWQVVEWEEALDFTARELKALIEKEGPDQVGALASPNSTVEEFYLLQKLMRGLGSPHIDHRLRECDFSDQDQLGDFMQLEMPIAELSECDAILLIGSNIQKEQPMLGLRVRKAALNGASIVAINAVDYDFNFAVTEKIIVNPAKFAGTLSALVSNLNEPIKKTKTKDSLQPLSQQLKGKQKIAILLGAAVQHHPEAAMIRFQAQQLAELLPAKLGFLTQGANGAGAWLTGAIPHRREDGSESHHGLNAYSMLEKPRKAYILLNVEPDLDCANSVQAMAALKQARLVVALATFHHPSLEAHATVILPTAPFTETAGSFVNVTGEWQRFNGVAKNWQESRPAWKILRVLGNFMDLTGFDFESADEVNQAVKALIDQRSPRERKLTPVNNEPMQTDETQLVRVGEVPLYSTDPLVRRAEPLQQTQSLTEHDFTFLRVHPDTAKALNVAEGEMVEVIQSSATKTFKVAYDTRLADKAVWLAGGTPESIGLGGLMSTISINKIKSATC